jgi:hypothetical protein
MPTIDQVLPRRSDFSNFLVHLTRNQGDSSAKDILFKIIEDERLIAGQAFGHAHSKMAAAKWSTKDQKCVCFTEVPLEHICLLSETIEGRSVKMEPYGIVVPKKYARKRDVNPVWYLDQTVGREWLSNPLNKIIDEAIKNERQNHSILKLTPFIEQFGEYKDFHWEREWRCVGDFYLPDRYMVIAPEDDHIDLKAHIKENVPDPKMVSVIDSFWSLERVIANLAGYRSKDL